LLFATAISALILLLIRAAGIFVAPIRKGFGKYVLIFALLPWLSVGVIAVLSMVVGSRG
jgi:hypothetical protein